MKSLKKMMGGLCLMCAVAGCSTPAAKDATTSETNTKDGKNAVIENILTRRSIRKYLPQAVNRDTMQIILNCGINAGLRIAGRQHDAVGMVHGHRLVLPGRTGTLHDRLARRCGVPEETGLPRGLQTAVLHCLRLSRRNACRQAAQRCQGKVHRLTHRYL